MIELVQDVRTEIMAACGIPPGLFGDGAAASIRESWRLTLFATIGPLGRVVLRELTDKLDDGITIGWEELRASDIAGRARAFQGLVKGGMPMADAIAVAGLMTEDT